MRATICPMNPRVGRSRARKNDWSITRKERTVLAEANNVLAKVGTTRKSKSESAVTLSTDRAATRALNGFKG
jgi:hypothetical protein